MSATRAAKPTEEWAIFAIPSEPGRQVRCVSRLRDRRLTSLPRNVLRFPTREAARMHKTLLDRLPRITYVVDTIPPLPPGPPPKGKIPSWAAGAATIQTSLFE
jgi:hypothetical protein